MNDFINMENVVVNNTDVENTISPEYVYMTIPSDYVCVYHKLLVYIADFGKDIINDCSASCKGNGKNIINCWSLFQSAIACYNIGKVEESEFFIDYIEKQLENIYKGSDNKVYQSSTPISITPDGKLKTIVSCDKGVKFYVDENTGKLYQEYLEEAKDNKVYTIIDNDLTVVDDNE